MMNLISRFPVVLFIVAACALIGCGEKNEIKAPGAGEADSSLTGKLRPDQQIYGAAVELFRGSGRTTQIRADYIEKYSKQDSALAWKLNVSFYNDSGLVTTHLIADSGLVREITQEMVANGHVVVTTEDSSRLETQQLFWNGRDEMVTTDSFVTIYQKGDTLRGYGLEADRGLKRVKIKRQVTGTLKNAEGVTE